VISNPTIGAFDGLEPFLDRARKGDAEAFCHCAAAYETRLFRQAMALSGDFHAAEDLVAETMIEAWRSLPRFNGACRFSTWLYAILLHRYQKSLRRNQSRPVPWTVLSQPGSDELTEAVARLSDPQPIACETLVQNESSARLQAAVSELPETHQTVVLLRFYEGASLAEIAAALQLPVGTIKSRLHYALARLRDMPEVMNLWNSGGDI